MTSGKPISRPSLSYIFELAMKKYSVVLPGSSTNRIYIYTYFHTLLFINKSTYTGRRDEITRPDFTKADT